MIKSPYLLFFILLILPNKCNSKPLVDIHLTFSLTKLPFLLLISIQILIISATQPPDTSSPSSYASVRNTLAHYPLAIDGKDFSLLSQVFTYNAVANYSPPMNTLYGLPQIEPVLEVWHAGD